MRFFSIIAILAHCNIAVDAATCTADCSTEFMKCIRAKESYAGCHDLLDEPKMQSAGCVSGCSDSSEMAKAKIDYPGEINNGNRNANKPSTGCTESILGTPSTPTLCTKPEANPAVYTFFPMSGTYAKTQRYFSIYYPGGQWANSTKARPVVLEMSGYGGQSFVNANSKSAKAADRYGFAVIDVSSPLNDGNGGFGLAFPNNGIANDTNPIPCKKEDSRDFVFIEAIFTFIAQSTSEVKTKLLDVENVFTMGFSQNSMFSAYVAVCFSDLVAGVWQGGSGLAKTGYSPVTPAQCTESSSLANGNDCCKVEFCKDCRYWPVYPKTCSKRIVDCIASYTNDEIACGTDLYMYEAMVKEDNDARFLSFSPTTDIEGGHKNPQNPWSWKAGCLGLSVSCTSSCETSFKACVQSETGKSTEKFENCETKIDEEKLIGCVKGCSPTLGMLQLSESPVVSLSKGQFGTLTGLTITATAPTPKCTNSIGWFGDPGYGACRPTAGTLPTQAYTPSVSDTCGAGYSYNGSAGVLKHTSQTGTRKISTIVNLIVSLVMFLSL